MKANGHKWTNIMKMLLMISLVIFIYILSISTYKMSPSLVFNSMQIRNTKIDTAFRMSQQADNTLKSLIAKIDMLVVVPLNCVGIKEITGLNTALIGEPYRIAVSKTQLIEIIDRTPFCQIADYISEQNFCVFIENSLEENFDRISKWIRVTKREGEFMPSASPIILCKKENCVYIRTCEIGFISTPIKSINFSTRGEI